MTTHICKTEEDDDDEDDKDNNDSDYSNNIGINGKISNNKRSRKEKKDDIKKKDKKIKKDNEDSMKGITIYLFIFTIELYIIGIAFIEFCIWIIWINKNIIVIIYYLILYMY